MYCTWFDEIQDALSRPDRNRLTEKRAYRADRPDHASIDGSDRLRIRSRFRIGSFVLGETAHNDLFTSE